jgi:phosphate/sulfate permease
VIDGNVRLVASRNNKDKFMNLTFWEALGGLSGLGQALFFLALFTAFAFEFINGFHDTANAVTTVIYTKTLRPTPAVFFSGFMNFLGVLVGGTTVAFSIVNLLPVDLLIEGSSTKAIIMVMSLLFAGVIWNLGTWWMGLPVSSSHTLIGSILGVGLANSLMTDGTLLGVNWAKAADVGKALLLSPLIGFVAAALLLMLMRVIFRNPNLYHPPGEGDNPPSWIRGVLIATCGGVSFAHGSNDGQKGMGLILLALIGFLPTYYAMDLRKPELAREVHDSARSLQVFIDQQASEQAESGLGHDTAPEGKADEKSARIEKIRSELSLITSVLDGKRALSEVAPADRWAVRQSIYRVQKGLAGLDLSKDALKTIAPARDSFKHAIEYVPLWVVIGVALALGIGTTIGYKRIVVTIAEKIGKTHLTYAQGAAAETVAAITIGLADMFHAPVSTTQVLSSGIAGTMWANKSGVQFGTIRKILIAWILTLPMAILLGGGLFFLGVMAFDGVKLH